MNSLWTAGLRTNNNLERGSTTGPFLFIDFFAETEA